MHQLSNGEYEMSEQGLLVKDVLKWAIKEFGYYGHLTKLAGIIGMSRTYWKAMKHRGTVYVPPRHVEKLLDAANGKLKLVDKK